MKPSLTGTELSPMKMRSIPKWTQTYARNRSLGLVLLLIVYGAISGASHFSGQAYDPATCYFSERRSRC